MATGVVTRIIALGLRGRQHPEGGVVTGVRTRLCTLTMYCGIWNYEKGCRGAIHCVRLGSRSAFQCAMNCAPTLCSVASQVISSMCIIASNIHQPKMPMSLHTHHPCHPEPQRRVSLPGHRDASLAQ